MIVGQRSSRLSLVSRRRAVRSIGVAAQIIIATGLAGCTGYSPGAKTFWNEEVRKLCERDGGVTIYDRVQISKADIDRHVLPTTADGKLGVTVKELAHPEVPVFAESKTTILREWSPQVGRVEWTVIRRSDSAVVARWVSYGRHGGDFPTGLAHESSFSCPDSQQIRADLQRLFVVGESQ